MNNAQSSPGSTFTQFSVYHVDRLNACKAGFHGLRRVVGIEVAARSRIYAWRPVSSDGGWHRRTLFPGALLEDISWTRRLRQALDFVSAERTHDVFLCNQDQREILALLPLLRRQGPRAHATLDAKFDDSQRRERASRRPAGCLPRGHHHAGTMRMAAHAHVDVVNADCPLFDVLNLFLCGNSVFRTSGYANRTLTIVALSLRRANHLFRQLRELY